MTLRKKNVGYGRVLAVSLLLGSNDGCHIPTKCPPGGLEACKEYHDFKNFNSILLMGLVDSHYRFVWGSCNFPGFIWVFSLICAVKMIHYRSLLAETSLTNALDKRYCSYSLCLIRTSESSLLCAGLDPMISKAVFLFSVSRTSTDFVWVHWFSLQGHLCHVASLPVILWNHGELICGSCHNIYLASRIPLLLGAFFPFGSICKMVLREVVLLPFDPFSELHKAL